MRKPSSRGEVTDSREHVGLPLFTIIIRRADQPTCRHITLSELTRPSTTPALSSHAALTVRNDPLQMSGALPLKNLQLLPRIRSYVDSLYFSVTALATTGLLRGVALAGVLARTARMIGTQAFPDLAGPSGSGTNPEGQLKALRKGKEAYGADRLPIIGPHDNASVPRL